MHYKSDVIIGVSDFRDVSLLQKQMCKTTVFFWF